MARWIGQREQTVGDGAKIVPADHGIGRCDVRLQPVEQIEDGVPFAEAASLGREAVAVMIRRDSEHADPAEDAGIRPVARGGQAPMVRMASAIDVGAKPRSSTDRSTRDMGISLGIGRMAAVWDQLVTDSRSATCACAAA